MRKELWLLFACLLGGLLVLLLVSGLGTTASASGTAVYADASALDVVINEVAWGGTAASSHDEWIELYNTTDSALDLAGWSIYGADSETCLNFSAADGWVTTTIPAHGYLIYANHSDDVRDDGGNAIVDIWDATVGMNNAAPGQLTLYDAADCGGSAIDTVNSDGGGWPGGSASPDYASMERRDPTDAGGDGNWCTNDGITTTSQDADGNALNATPKAQNSCYQPPAEPAADLVVAKVGPQAVGAGSVITYYVTVSNTGAISAANTLITDTLPAVIDFLTQTSPFTFSQAGRTLSWAAGDVLSGAQHLITFTVQVTDDVMGFATNYVSVTTTAREVITANNAAHWTTRVGGSPVLISAVLYDGYQTFDPDEAVQLVNVGAYAVDLTDWQLCDRNSGGSCVTLTGTLSTGERIWLTDQALSFTLSFGFPPDYEADGVDPSVPNLVGAWPGFANSGDEVVLRDGAGAVMDAVVYEGGDTAIDGWGGNAVHPYGNWGQPGQILYRTPDEATGLPCPDTDTAADWIQYAGDTAYGRRVLYPGWDLDPLFWPLTATEPATVVVGIAPDHAFGVVSQTIARAQRSISVEVYSLRHPQIVTALVQKARAGVSVTVLLEGRQAVVSYGDDGWQQELWACQQIEAAGGQCWFMVDDHDPGTIYNRYDYVHAKFMVLDDEWVLISSQNLTDSGLPADDKSNGTYGSRGVVLATNAPSVVARAGRVFALDLDPAHHNDLLRWNAALTGTYGPPVITYTPRVKPVDYVTSSIDFEAPLAISATVEFELFTAPEAALRRSDGLLGLVGRAGVSDTVYVEQMYEHVDWGDDPITDPNLRLQAYISAARRGAKVRILLNKGTFGGPSFGTPNTATVAYVNQIARQEGLNLRAALGDPTQYGIHNKMVLVWLHDAGGYAHVGSINGSETSNKVNREMAIQLRSDAVYHYLADVFDLDWNWSQPVYVPLVMARYTPPADHLLISEVDYQGNCEWVEIYNPTALTVTLTGLKIGDARRASDYEGMYIFPHRTLGPDEVIVVAGDAATCDPAYITVDYELFGAASPGVPNLTRDQGWGTGEFGLGNAGDEVLLLDPSNHVVDVVVYGSGAYAGVTPHPGVAWGDTLERIPANVDTNDCAEDFQPGWSPNGVRFSD